MHMVDKSNIGIILWFVLVVVINVEWIAVDLWLRAHGHEYLTTEFREGLRNPIWGPFIAGAIAFTVVTFVTHMLIAPRQ